MIFKSCFVWMCLMVLAACVSPPTRTTPERLDWLYTEESESSAYLWSYGKNEHSPAWDYAIVVEIDGIRIPAEFIPPPSDVPVRRVLFELPAGDHEILLIYKEDNSLKAALCVPFCAYGSEKSHRTLTITAEAGRIYVPFVSDRYSCEWYWVEDWGEYEPGMETEAWAESLRSSYDRPVAAGAIPVRGTCENQDLSSEGS